MLSSLPNKTLYTNMKTLVTFFVPAKKVTKKTSSFEQIARATFGRAFARGFQGCSKDRLPIVFAERENDSIKIYLPPQHTQSQAARRRVKRPVKRLVSGALFFWSFAFLKRKGHNMI